MNFGFTLFGHLVLADNNRSLKLMRWCFFGCRAFLRCWRQWHSKPCSLQVSSSTTAERPGSCTRPTPAACEVMHSAEGLTCPVCGYLPEVQTPREAYVLVPTSSFGAAEIPRSVSRAQRWSPREPPDPDFPAGDTFVCDPERRDNTRYMHATWNCTLHDVLHDSISSSPPKPSPSPPTNRN